MDLAQANAGSAKRAKAHAGEILVSLFQRFALLGDPYLDSFRRHVTFEPERQLMRTVLEDAIKTLQDNLSASGGERRRLFEAAEEWVFGADSDWVFFLVSVGRALGIDPNYPGKGLDPCDTSAVTRVQTDPMAALTQ